MCCFVFLDDESVLHNNVLSILTQSIITYSIYVHSLADIASAWFLNDIYPEHQLVSYIYTYITCMHYVSVLHRTATPTYQV